MTCDHDRIFADLASRKADVREQAIKQARVDEHADALLARLLDLSNDPVYEKLIIAAYLGDERGPDGDRALTQLLDTSGPGSRDLRCSALVGLAKRHGAESTPLLLRGLTARDGAVREYAVYALAAVGDDRAWVDVFEWTRSLLRRKRRRSTTPHDLHWANASEMADGLSYLAQHLADPGRRLSLVSFVRDHWDAVNERAWVDRFWPEVHPDGTPAEQVDAPDPEPIRAWARKWEFDPVRLD